MTHSTIAATVRQMADASGLAFVPAVVAALGAGAADALLAAARAGLVELRPESGLGRLTAAELAACPTMPDYFTGGRLPLSWARAIG